VFLTPSRAAIRPENGETMPAVIGPGAIPTAASSTDSDKRWVNSSVVPSSMAAKPT
jgi:hypothetical protein